MLELSSVVLAIVQGASGALASHLLDRRNEPVDIRAIIDEAVSELREKDRELSASVSETTEALQSLKAVIDRIPELEIREGYNIVYQPSKNSDLSDALYRLDEEIEALRGSSDRITQTETRITYPEQSRPWSSSHTPSVLDGLDEEIARLRSGDSGLTPLIDRSET